MNIEELRAKAVQAIIIPGFAPGETIEVQVQRPGLMGMMAQGKIPNPLMSQVTQLLKGQDIGKGKEVDFVSLAKTFEFFCSACMVTPTYTEMKDIITDDQMMAVFNWAMGGVQKMSSFRPKQENGSDHQHVQGVRVQAE